MLSEGFVTVATPRGRLTSELIPVLERAGFDVTQLKTESRSLLRAGREANFLILRNEDVPTYVGRGAAAIGVVGKDVLAERSGCEVIEYADLGFGKCEMVLAFPRERPPMPGSFVRVATKYPNIAREAMKQMPFAFEIISLKGSCEIAPAVGLADAIVDLSASGETLRANNLQVYATFHQYTARLILNPGAYRLDKRVRQLADSLLASANVGGMLS